MLPTAAAMVPPASAMVATSAAASATPPVVAEPPRADPILTEENLPHLCCSVCLSFPEKEVLQCHSGHLLCRDCYDRVCHEQKPTCPTCRTALDPLKPVRNVALEQTLAMLPVACPNRPCAEKLTRGSLTRHVEHECMHRAVQCKYHLLGCKWAGVAADCVKHVDSCKRAVQPGWKLLPKVAARVQDVTQKHEAALTEARRAELVCSMLSGRCKNIAIVNVQLHKCSASEHVAGRPAHLMSAGFYALGFRFKLYTLVEPGARYLAVLKLCDSRSASEPRTRARMIERVNPPGGTSAQPATAARHLCR